MTDNLEATKNGVALEGLFSKKYLERAKNAADTSPWRPIELKNAVAVYSRRSSDDKNQSIDRQDEESDEYAETVLKLKVSYHFSDEGISGETSYRPGLEQLLIAARLGKFRYVVVEDVDRVGRRLGIIGTVFDELEDLGIEAHSLFKQGRLFKQDVILKSLAATEHQTLLRSRSGGSKSVAIDKGRIVSPMPIGYIRDPHIIGQYRVDPVCVDAIKWAFEARRTGLACEDISEGMKAFIADPEFKPPRKSYMGALLSNPIFKGVYTYGRRTFIRVNGKIKMRWNPPSQWKVRYYEHLRIVDDDLWEAVSQTFKKTSPLAAVNRLLTGKVVCARCGKIMDGLNGTTTCERNHYSRYQCRYFQRKYSPCRGTRIRALAAEQAALDAIAEVLSTDGLEEIFQAMLDEELGKQRAFIEERRKELVRLQTQKKSDLDLEMAIHKELFREALEKGKELPSFMSDSRELLAAELEDIGAKIAVLPDLSKRVIVSSSKRRHLIEVFAAVSNLAGQYAKDYTPQDLFNLGLMRELIDRIDLETVPGSRSHKLTIHVSIPAITGVENIGVTIPGATRSFVTYAHTYKGHYRKEDIKTAYDDGVHALSDAEYDLVLANFREEISKHGGEAARKYGIRRSLDHAVFVATTSLPVIVLRRAGLDTRRGAMKLTRGLAKSGIWAQIAAMLEREFPHRKGSFNPEMTQRLTSDHR